MSGTPEHVGILGGGRMGAGIAHAFVLSGSAVTIVEADAERAGAAETRVRVSVEASLARGAASGSVSEFMSRVEVSTQSAALRASGLIVEALPEDAALKQTALRGVEAVAEPTAWLATNTSSLSIGGLAAGLENPARLIGLHFFNPVPASALVEIVVADTTDPALVDAAAGWVTGLGKTAITAKDRPGFASSRLGIALALEAMRMVEEGVASAGDIDRAMTLGYRHQRGPLATSDIVGLDVRLAIADHLHQTLGDRFEAPAVLRRKVAAGELGHKSGRGFFFYDDAPDAQR